MANPLGRKDISKTRHCATYDTRSQGPLSRSTFRLNMRHSHEKLFRLVAVWLKRNQSGFYLGLGFGMLTLLLLALGVFATVRLNKISRNAHAQVKVARPRTAVTRELESRALGYALNVRSVLDGFAEARQFAANDVVSVAQNLAAYERLVETSREHELALTFAERWHELRTLGDALMLAGHASSGEMALLLERRVALEQLIDNGMQPDALASLDAGTTATLSNVAWTKRVSLLLLSTSLAIALATSIAIGRMLRQAQQELIRRERLATLGRLAGHVAHHLRTPLCVIQNSIFCLENTLPHGDETLREVLAETKRAVGKSNHIITEMLDYVRELPADKENFPIGTAVSRALEAVPLPGEIFVQNCPGEAAGVEVRANLDQVVQILINLIQNAVDAMPQGGELELCAGVKEGGKVCVSVRDTGCGIPKENLEKIFDPLFSTNLRKCGLGLPIAQRYAQVNGGILTAESEVGRGTTFRLMLSSRC